MSTLTLKTLGITASLAVMITLSACNKADKDAATNIDETQITKEAAPAMTDAEQIATNWLAENAKRDGVVVRPSGLQVVIDKSGDPAGSSPAAGQNVKVHYEGMLTDGTVFDSSYARGEPAIFPSDRLIAGWVEALSEMKPGDAWTLYVPPNLAYGKRNIPDGKGGVLIPADSVLVFRMELLENM